ncbi:MAG: outer membrane protein assembly factor BamD [Gammaproteobacteria bacterium]|nr:outer membrane protein assembly factor BamD [Gammaproteobacteria bacterium]
MFHNIRYLQLICILCLILISGCSTVKGLFGDDEDEDPTISEDISARQLYQKANGEMQRNQFADAIESYTLLESRYPFGRYAQQAQLELTFLYYRQSNMDASISSADRFIKLNPQHPNVDYAHYMKGLANFDKSKSFLNYILPRNPSDKDPAPLMASFDIFNNLIQKFPDSYYAEDAKQRMIYLRNELAEYELTVADFYMRRGAYVAAANRAKYVMEKYQGAPAMPQAVYTLELAYRQLGINDLAYDTRKVYAANFLGKDGKLLDPNYATTKISCATNVWDRVLEKLNLKTYYCN